ncbi:hypothetical protein OS493_015243 [Desmophyllum pertusum]|uniref:Uncharacterized protein n=1 Tax=Desmophyllum pertusum TaxID=174260 RepID=A0A9W9ZDL5_9CNID|nr:hypothetical protein OS493_015243 [Desmophyllum pertusum]
MPLMSAGEAQSGFLVERNNSSVVTGTTALAISPLQSERLRRYHCSPWRVSALPWQTHARLDCSIDNKAIVSSWQKQASKTPALSHVMKSIFQLTLRFNLALTTSFVPSADNPADRPSRTLSDIDCKLSSLAWKSVQLAYGPHSLDLLALPSNFQRDLHNRPLRFYAPFPNPGCPGVNVFAQTVSRLENAYAFPPFILLGPLLKFLSPQPCPLTIIAPDLRPRQYWWPILQHRVSSCFKIGSKALTYGTPPLVSICFVPGMQVPE